LYEPSVRDGRVHRRVHAGNETMQQLDPTNLRRERSVAKRFRLSTGLHRGRLWSVHSGRQAVQRPNAADV
jgi:hypothetical protein